MGVPPLSITMSQLRSLIAAEIGHLVETDRLLIVRAGTQWHATLKGNGARLDEAQLAAVSAAGRRLLDRYSIVPDDSVQDAAAKDA